jgi:hypothetical protein
MMDARFVKDFITNKVEYEVRRREIEGLPSLTEDEIEKMAIVETVRLIETHFNLSDLFQLLSEISDEEDGQFETMRKEWRKALNGNPAAISKMFESC